MVLQDLLQVPLAAQPPSLPHFNQQATLPIFSAFGPGHDALGDPRKPVTSSRDSGILITGGCNITHLHISEHPGVTVIWW